MSRDNLDPTPSRSYRWFVRYNRVYYHNNNGILAMGNFVVDISQRKNHSWISSQINQVNSLHMNERNLGKREDSSCHDFFRVTLEKNWKRSDCSSLSSPLTAILQKYFNLLAKLLPRGSFMFSSVIGNISPESCGKLEKYKRLEHRRTRNSLKDPSRNPLRCSCQSCKHVTMTTL